MGKSTNHGVLQKLLSVIVIVFFGVRCTQVNFDKSDTRFLSAALFCETDSLCFSKADSLLLWKEEEPALTNMTWRELSKTDTILNFHEYTGHKDYATILVLDNYEAKEAGGYILRLGSDDGFRVFVNGEEVASRIIGRALQLDSDWIPIHLNEGTNQLIIQVNQGTGDWKLHYKVDRGEHLEALMEDQLIEIYRDLPDQNILSDTSMVLKLNKDPRQNLDTWHTITYQWIDPENGEEEYIEDYPAHEAPGAVPLPEAAKFPLLFRYEVHHAGGRVLYSESIPVFSKSSVSEYVPALYKELSSKTENQQWKRGLQLLFPDELETEQVQTYSTRIKSEFLWDALNHAGYDLYEIGGPRMTNINGLISRMYRPDDDEKEVIKVFGISPQPEDTLGHYLESYHGHTHNSLRVRSSYARYFNTELTFPFIQQYSENNNLEVVLTGYTSQLPESESFNIIAWSNSVPLLLEVLGEHSFPVDNVALLGSFLGDDPTRRFMTIQKIKHRNPGISWYIFHGEEDERVPVSVMEKWVKAFEGQGFSVRYERLPLTDHEVYFTDPRKKFYRFITAN